MIFKRYLTEQETEAKIYTLIYLSTLTNNINETDINEGLKNWLKDVGLNLQQNKTDNIIDYAMDFTSNIGMLVLAAIKRDRHQVKAIADMFDQEAFQDFLLKLDQLTLGLITGPLEFISSITGWNIVGAMDAATKNTKRVLGIINTSINNIKKNIPKIMDNTKQAVIKTHLSNIEINIPT